MKIWANPSNPEPKKYMNKSALLSTDEMDMRKELKTQVIKARIPNVEPVRLASFFRVPRCAMVPIAMRVDPRTANHSGANRKTKLYRSSDLRTLKKPKLTKPQAVKCIKRGRIMKDPKGVKNV